MDNAEEIQKKFCSNSRHRMSEIPDRMGKRLIRNIEEAHTAFSAANSAGVRLLDVGCGDGLGLQRWIDFGFSDCIGIEFVRERVETALRYGLSAIKGSAEDLSFFPDRSCNVFCSHTLEHVQDQAKAIREIQRVAARLVWIIVPIEFKRKSGNVAHLSPIEDLSQIKEFFSTTDWIKIKEEYRTNLEPEGVIAFLRR